MMKQCKKLRGGSWDDFRDVARAVFRYNYDPDIRDDDLGFRVMHDEPCEARLRGGSWLYYQNDARAVYCSDLYPGGRNFNIGFRVVHEEEEV